MPSIARQLGISLLVAAAATLTAAGARANPGFPLALQQNVPMPCLPQCTLCHNSNLGGPGNIRPSSMGTTWIMYGLDGTKPETLVTALANARGAMQDTDGDMTPDVDELVLGHDPDNPAMGALICGSDVSAPVYGCVRVARQGPVDNVAAAAGAFVALIGLSSLRRRAASKRRVSK